MGGSVEFGTSNDHHQGVVNMRQFGPGTWEARRIA
jgi:hypothetical protein